MDQDTILTTAQKLSALYDHFGEKAIAVTEIFILSRWLYITQNSRQKDQLTVRWTNHSDTTHDPFGRTGFSLCFDLTTGDIRAVKLLVTQSGDGLEIKDDRDMRPSAIHAVTNAIHQAYKKHILKLNT